MKQEIIGKIENVSLKREGETNGRKWQMFSVIIAGQEFTSFDWQFKNLIGKEGHYFYEEKTTEKNGKQYVNKTLENLPRPKPNFATIDELKVLEARIKKLEDMIINSRTPQDTQDFQDKMNHPEYENMGDDIKAEDLPF